MVQESYHGHRDMSRFEKYLGSKLILVPGKRHTHDHCQENVHASSVSQNKSILHGEKNYNAHETPAKENS